MPKAPPPARGRQSVENVLGGLALRARRRDRALAGAQERFVIRVEEGVRGGTMGSPTLCALAGARERLVIRAEEGVRGRTLGAATMVACDVDGAALADHGHLHLAGILELVFDLARDLVREQGCRVVVDAARAHDHPDLTPALMSVDLVHARLRPP